MPQVQLPIYPEGVTHITSELAFKKEAGQVTYFNGSMPVFIHDEDDVASFRMITAQFCVNGTTTQAQISRAFGVPLISMKRAIKRYRTLGIEGFYQKQKSRGAAVLTEAVLACGQQLFDEGLETPAVAEALSIKCDTLAKAVRAGKLHKSAKKKSLRTS